ncbi:MAG TPA: hypothetical protein VGB67_13750, partial [Fibrella sp.]
MIELIMALFAIAAYFGGVATKDFIRPALPGRKTPAMIESITSTKLKAFPSHDYYYFWSNDRLREAWFAAKSGSDLEARIGKYYYGHQTNNRDVNLYSRMVKLHDSTQDLSSRAAVVTMWQNHLLPAWLLQNKANGDAGAKARYTETLDLIEENLKFIEAGYQADIEMQQRQLIGHLKTVKKALNPPPIDSNLDLSKPKAVESVKPVHKVKPRPMVRTVNIPRSAAERMQK